MTPKQQDERSLDAVTRKVADDYFRLCHEAGDKPVAAGLWTAHLQSALLNNINAISAHLEAQGDAAKDAARYRFLRNDEHTFAVFMPRKHGHIAFLGEGLDARIDAAITTDAEAKP